MVPLPKPVQCVAVSTTERPVTHTALVAVKSASRKDVLRPVAVAWGIIKRIVPMPIIAAKDTGRSRNGFDRKNLLAREEISILSI
jgi:hypothetical protein